MPRDIGEQRGQGYRLAERVVLVADHIPRSFTQPIRSSRVFHTSPSRPPGRSTRNLGDGPLWIEPMPCLSHQNASTLLSGKGICSAVPSEPGCRAVVGQQFQHLSDRIDGDDIKAPFDEAGGQLSVPAPGPASRAFGGGNNRWLPVDTTDGRVRTRRPLNRRTVSVPAGFRPSSGALAIGYVQCSPDQLAHLLRFDETVVAVVGFDRVQSVAAGQQVSQLLLQAQRIQPVGGDAANYRQYRARTESGAHRRGCGRRRDWTTSRSGDVGPRIEARDQFGALMFPVALDAVPATAQRIFVALPSLANRSSVPAHRGKSGERICA